MKKLNLNLLLMMLLIVLPVMQSCDDDDEIAGYRRMATVRVISGNTFYLENDRDEKLWISSPSMSWYKAVDGQRVIVDYTLLSDQYEDYDHLIHVYRIFNVLTKTVEDLTEENEDVYGNDPVWVEEMWVGGNYLNVQFRFPLPNFERHRVSLVKNTLAEDEDDGYIHLEYRYNNQDDVTNRWTRSFVSFNLGDYAPEVASDTYKGIKVWINSAVNGEKPITINYTRTDNQREIYNMDELDPIEDKVD